MHRAEVLAAAERTGLPATAAIDATAAAASSIQGKYTFHKQKPKHQPLNRFVLLEGGKASLGNPPTIYSCNLGGPPRDRELYFGLWVSTAVLLLYNCSISISAQQF
ncbi:hypothetical protein DFP73DRAFT_531733 [Morchella snyderi]|nr:hypothetical protein DFP73DRAFT_531733 [Morchella snyderi]